MVEEYKALLDAYRRMFAAIDIFHFNSHNTADVYHQFIPTPESKVIPITHAGIGDHRRRKEFATDILKLGFIGSEASYKGLPLLKEMIAKLNQEGKSKDVELSVYSGRIGQDDVLCNVVYKGSFTNEMMSHIYDSIDLLVVPSICFETFSFVTLEALSFGTPVLVSSHVGAKDVVMQYAPGYVFETKDDLYSLIKRLVRGRDELIQYNKAILEKEWAWSLERHAKEIVKQLYY